MWWLLTSRLGRSALGALAIAGALAYGYSWAFNRGHRHAELEAQARAHREAVAWERRVDALERRAEAAEAIAMAADARRETQVKRAISAARKSRSSEQMFLDEEMVNAIRAIE